MSLLEKIKSMDRNSNAYTIMYSSAMVIIVALLLAVASTALKPAQTKNVETEKKIDILRSIGMAEGVEKASNKHSYVSENFTKYIAEQYVVNSNGDTITGVIAFNVDMKIEMAKPLEQRNLPVYRAKLDDGSVKYIIPLRGRGLWGPIWGYIALNDDLNTIYGATFAHQGETPGLGAEISTPEFQQQFKGKSIFQGDSILTFTSVKVVKGGATVNDPHGVDAISGGTITSKGLESMLFDCLSGYQNYFDKVKKQFKS